MANTFDFDGTITGNSLASDGNVTAGGNVQATGIVKTSDTFVVVDDALEAELTAILGDISYTG